MHLCIKNDETMDCVCNAYLGNERKKEKRDAIPRFWLSSVVMMHEEST